MQCYASSVFSYSVVFIFEAPTCSPSSNFSMLGLYSWIFCFNFVMSFRSGRDLLLRLVGLHLLCLVPTGDAVCSLDPYALLIATEVGTCLYKLVSICSYSCYLLTSISVVPPLPSAYGLHARSGGVRTRLCVPLLLQLCYLLVSVLLYAACSTPSVRS